MILVEVNFVSDSESEVLRCHGGSSIQGTAKSGRRRAFNHGLNAHLTESVRIANEPWQGLLRAIGFGNLVNAG